MDIFDNLRQDLRYATRSLRARPMLAAVVVASLALGVGVNTAIFSVFEHLLLRQLPVPAPDEIVNITAPGPRPGSSSTGDSGGQEAIFSYPLFRDLEGLANTPLAGIAAHVDFTANVAFRALTTEARGLLVSGGYFRTLGIAPARGRFITTDDDRTGSEPVAVLSHRYWTLGFQADERVVGERLVLNGVPVTIIGVTPEGFSGTTVSEPAEVFVPLATMAVVRLGGALDRRDDHQLYLFGRLRPGVSRHEAERVLNVPFTSLVRDVEVPELRTRIAAHELAAFAERRIALEDGTRGRLRNRDQMRVILAILFAVTGFVLLIACANVANLLLARVTDRAGELGVRLSLGASSWRVLRLLLLEAAMLGAAGGLGALLVARAAITGLLTLIPVENTVFLQFGISRPVFLFALSVGIGTGVLFGLFPALQAVSGARQGLTAATSARASSSRRATRLRTTLATAQIALATALLAEAGLLVVNLTNLSSVELGIEREGLVTFRVAPGQNGYSPERSRAVLEAIERDLRGLPGVVSVSASSVAVLSGTEWGQRLTVQGSSASDDASRASYANIGTGYFRTLGIPLLFGRDFTEADVTDTPQVAIVNETFVRQFSLGDRAVGTRLARGRGPQRPFDVEIVGVVRDAKYSELRDATPAQVFFPYRQYPTGRLTFYVRTTGDPRGLLAAIQPVVTRTDANLPVTNLWPMDYQVWERTTGERVLATLSSSFAGVAALLAAIGLYAVLAYAVARRQREFGIRIALGATPATVRHLVLAHVGKIAAIGAAIGAALAIGLGQLGESMLFGVDALEPGILSAAVALVAIVVAAAGFVPAQRAAGVNATEALRAE